MTGLPQARMKYSDAPGGGDYELTPNQLEILTAAQAPLPARLSQTTNGHD